MDPDLLRSELRLLADRRAAMLDERAAVSDELERLLPIAREAGIGSTELAALTGLTRAGVHLVLNRAK